MSAEDPESNAGTLQHIHVQERAELEYRRRREFQVFTATAGLLLAVIASLVIREEDRRLDQLLDSWLFRMLLVLLIAGLTAFSIKWQASHRRTTAEHAKVIVRISDALGCYTPGKFGQREPLFPPHWKGWGTRHLRLREQLVRPGKVLATLLLGLLAAAAAIWS